MPVKFVRLYSAVSLALIGALCHGCKERPTDIYKAKHTKEELWSKLNTIYSLDSGKARTDSMAAFFTEWNKSVKPNSPAYINSSDTLQALFSLYRFFYQPYALSKLGDWEIADSYYVQNKYVIVQDSIHFGVSDHEWEGRPSSKATYRSITYFRPPLDIDSSKVLYLVPEYEYALANFLGVGSEYSQHHFHSNPLPVKGNAGERRDLLAPIVSIDHGNTLSYWMLETHPYIETILFNRNFTKAEVYFTVRYQWTRAFLKKNAHNTWEIDSVIMPPWID